MGHRSKWNEPRPPRGGACVAAILLVALVPACAEIISSDDLHKVDCVGKCAPDEAGDHTSVDATSSADAGDGARSNEDVSMRAVDGGEDETPPRDAADNEVGEAGVDAFADAGNSIDASPCIDVSGGILGHWPMDTSSIVGTQVRDVSQYKNHATLMGFSGSVTTVGKFGQALSYPATGSAYVELPSLSLDQSAGGMNSISMWFFRDAANVDDVLALLPNFPRYDLWLTHKAHISLCINTGNSDCFGIEDDGLTGRWVHVVAIFANGPTTNGRLYVDGVDRHPACVSAPNLGTCDKSATASQPIEIGGKTDFIYRGLIDDVRIYRRALNPDEITALYSGKACP
jgi:hypothetical protein